MTIPTPVPAPDHRASTAWKIEAKVIASTTATFAVSLVLAVLNAVQGNHDLLGSMPTALQTVILLIVPTAITFLGGYLARHTPRAPAGS
jgi:hypothetical protein